MGKLKLNSRFIIIIMLCVIVLGTGSFIYWSDSPGSKAVQLDQFKIAPDFELPDAQGNKYRLNDFVGNVVLLHFWASWCPPCLDEIPQWVELGAVFKDKKLKMIAVSLDQNWEDAHKILPSDKLTKNIISLLDPTNRVPDSYGSFQFPETYLIAGDKRVLMKWVGPQDWNSQAIRDFISTSLK